jgi:hypothetical protein
MSADLQQDVSKKMFADTMEFARLGIRATFLLNGGAILALLTFLGDIYKNSSSACVVSAVKLALPYYLVGVVASALTLFIAFLSQERFFDARVSSGNLASIVKNYVSQPEHMRQSTRKDFEDLTQPLSIYITLHTKRAVVLRVAAMACIVISLSGFIVGSIVAYKGF